MTLSHSEATGTLSIDGLALCSFNNETKLWEVGFLRHPHHELVLKVGGVRHPIPPTTSKITIETKRNDAPYKQKQNENGFFDPGSFNRKNVPANQDERENFRWVMDLDSPSDLPDHGRVTLKSTLPYPLTMAYISNAVFYTEFLSLNNLYLLPLGVDPATLGAAVNNRELGMEATLVGADIYCEQDEPITISFDGEKWGELEYTSHNPWKIEFTNMPAHNAPGRKLKPSSMGNWAEGDFKLYYDVINAAVKYSIWGLLGKNARGRTDCKPAAANGHLSGLKGR